MINKEQEKDAHLLLFDEPEAGIDLWSFNGLVEAFEELKKKNDKILLVISHQERLLEIADNIISMLNNTK